MYTQDRPTTIRLLDLVDSGVIDAKLLAGLCLGWMNERNVIAMAEVNGLLDIDECSNNED